MHGKMFTHSEAAPNGEGAAYSASSLDTRAASTVAATYSVAAAESLGTRNESVSQTSSDVFR